MAQFPAVAFPVGLSKRTDFSGRTDKYAPPVNGNSSLAQALNGSDVLDVGGIMSTAMRDQVKERLNRYRQNNLFYEGKHFSHPFEADGSKKLVINYARRITDTAADWLAARGVSFSPVHDGNSSVARLVNQVWDFNEGRSLLWRLAQIGGVNGDAYAYVTVKTKDEAGKDLAKADWSVSIKALDPAWVHPVWSKDEPEKMAACLIQFPFFTADNKKAVFSTIIETDKIRTWIDNELVSTTGNSLGEVNVVHIPHHVENAATFGSGEIDQISDLNTRVNTTASLIDRILKYHAEPTTIVYGATVSQLEKGSNKCWSGLPVDGKVENLQLQSDLKATYEWFNQLIKSLAVVGEMPMFLLDNSTYSHVSNTSGIAMQLLFQPLLAKTERSRLSYGKGLSKVAKLVLLCHQNIIGDNIAVLADSPESLFNLTVNFTNPLPRDENAELDLIIKKLNAGLVSEAQAIRDTSDIKDAQRLVLELAADRRCKLLLARENQIALQGGTPADSVVFLASPFLSEDLVAVASSLVAAAKPSAEGGVKKS